MCCLGFSLHSTLRPVSRAAFAHIARARIARRVDAKCEQDTSDRNDAAEEANQPEPRKLDHSCIYSPGQSRAIAKAGATYSHFISGLKLDNARQLALMHALIYVAAANGFTTGDLLPRVLDALGSGGNSTPLPAFATISQNCAPRASSKSCRTRAATGSSPAAI